ncbi:MAG: NUDIX domain-containing protein [Chloroflexi bacterium]|nr:NUDIX domain-containing protein [Chloroflexota bacterium]
MDETEFLKHLREEKLAAEELRGTYILKKLAYATALLGIGSLKIKPFELSFLLYLVPLVAFAFDLYILAEDYSVKRFGAFLGSRSTDTLERHWEKWIAQNRDPFAPLAMPILTTLLLLGAAAVIWFQGPAISPLYWCWLALAGLPSWILFAIHGSFRRRALREAESLVDGQPQPSMSLQRLRSAVGSADYVLDKAVYEKVRDLFSACSSNPQDLKNLRRLAPEYGKPEFLLCVDSNGSPAHPAQDLVEDFRKVASRHPNFVLWFQETNVEEDDKAILLIARWLCHLVGFRHRSVHLFIDHPTVEGYTLVQVRGLGKFESPGLFDLPAAGHVVGLESATDTLFKELKEELDWIQDDILDPQMVEGYNYSEPLSNPCLRNVEFRLVFRTRLKTDQLVKARFADGEVAAISVFSLSELQALINAFPERVASGLLESFPIYAKTKGAMH